MEVGIGAVIKPFEVFRNGDPSGIALVRRAIVSPGDVNGIVVSALVAV